jgi:geranylgeranyl pyrophosphate synthase
MPCAETSIPVSSIVAGTANGESAAERSGTSESAERSKFLRLLQRFAPQDAHTETRLAKCITAALSNPGGLFRVELAYHAAVAHGVAPGLAEKLSCALEYFHIASLLLDDLPMMDDSMERRGQICPHLLFGEGTAILASLALIVRAYALLGEVIVSAPGDRQSSAHFLVERCLGVAGIVNGQARDLGFHAAVQRSLEARQIALQKTVPLIEMALVLPGMIGGASRQRLHHLRRLSVCWGLLYQAMDDLADVALPSEVSGKTPGRDRQLGRPNVVHQLGRARTASYLDRLFAIAGACVEALVGEERGLAILRDLHAGLLQRRAALSKYD